MKRLFWAGLLSVLLLGTACERIQEPWIRSEQQLQQERARSREAAENLRQRLLRVQTDR